MYYLDSISIGTKLLNDTILGDTKLINYLISTCIRINTFN